FDQIPVEKIAESTEKIREVVSDKLQDISDKILKNEALSDDDQKNLLQTIKDVLNLDQDDEADEDA
ncbi:hypothetical protein GF337_17555, partial [candidate division KSB1 bacterium]|nr:hypothetical protein [candidate division KSB1 bacterium]